jgi:hypothetical protein
MNFSKTIISGVCNSFIYTGLKFIAGIVVTGDKLPPVSLLLAINHRRCRCYWRLIIAGVVVTGDKLIASVK